MAVFDLNDGSIAFLGLGMRVDEAEKPDPEPCPKIVGSFNNCFSLRAYDQAIMAVGTGGSMEVFPESPGDGLKIPFRLPGKEKGTCFHACFDYRHPMRGHPAQGGTERG